MDKAFTDGSRRPFAVGTTNLWRLFVLLWRTLAVANSNLFCSEFGEKPLRRPPSDNRSIRQSVGIHGLARDPPSLIYPLYLRPPSSYSNKASWNRVLSSSPNPATSSMLHLPSLASSKASQQDQKHSLHSEKVWIVFEYKSPLKVW